MKPDRKSFSDYFAEIRIAPAFNIPDKLPEQKKKERKKKKETEDSEFQKQLDKDREELKSNKGAK